MVYECISSFLQYKRQKAVHKAVQAMENKVDLQCNEIFHLEVSMVMYSIYNSDTPELIFNTFNTVHRLHNQSTWNEKLFAGQIEDWYHWYLSAKGVSHYAINSLFFLITTREKYVKMYERFINQLKEYLQAIGILSKVDQRNSIVQFPLFVHPYTQQHLILYQMETVPVPIVDENKKQS